MLVLLAILVLVVGLVARFNPLAVVLASAVTAGAAAGLSPLAFVSQLGDAFNTNRFVTAVFVVVPVIAMLERHGLQERARDLMGRLRGVTLGRLMFFYLLARQGTSALGLTQLGGQVTMVRPMLAPMALGAAKQDGSSLDADRVKAICAATDNIGLFFGEDIFLAIGSILLMMAVLEGYGIAVEPFELAMWAVPTAIAAMVVHGSQMLRLDHYKAPQTKAKT